MIGQSGKQVIIQTLQSKDRAKWWVNSSGLMVINQFFYFLNLFKFIFSFRAHYLAGKYLLLFCNPGSNVAWRCPPLLRIVFSKKFVKSPFFKYLNPDLFIRIQDHEQNQPA